MRAWHSVGISAFARLSIPPELPDIRDYVSRLHCNALCKIVSNLVINFIFKVMHMQIPGRVAVLMVDVKTVPLSPSIERITFAVVVYPIRWRLV